jgi:hypothetical protein
MIERIFLDFIPFTAIVLVRQVLDHLMDLVRVELLVAGCIELEVPVRDLLEFFLTVVLAMIVDELFERDHPVPVLVNKPESLVIILVLIQTVLVVIVLAPAWCSFLFARATLLNRIKLVVVPPATIIRIIHVPIAAISTRVDPGSINTFDFFSRVDSVLFGRVEDRFRDNILKSAHISDSIYGSKIFHLNFIN